MSAGGVAALIARGARAPTLRPLDAVMGEEWAVIRLGRGAAALRLEFLWAQAQAREARRAARRGPVAAGLAGGAPQALVKLVARGGARDRAGLLRQMDYLGRGGEVALQRSARYFGAAVAPDDIAALAAAWGVGRAPPGGAERTTHFLVSFPPGTDPGAAERAGRAWAEAMFAENRFGDSWDYYTAFHTDRAHPHIHVVVNRRGLEAGSWLKVSRRSAIDWDVLREVQVDVALAEGIALSATPRHARGLHDRRAPDAERRRAEREGRAPAPPAHSETSAILAAANVLAFARRIAADAALARAAHPRVAEALDAAAAALTAGAAPASGEHRIGAEEIAAMAETVETQRRGVLETFARMDREIAAVEDPAARARFERSTAAIRAEAAALMPDREDLQAWRDKGPNAGRETEPAAYRGVTARGPEGAAIKAEADARVRALAIEARLDPDATAARWDGPAPPAPLAAQWRREEAAALARAGEADEGRLEGLHRAIGAVYAEAGRAIAAREGREGAGRDAAGRAGSDEDLARARARDDGGFSL